jgi:aspartate aminotransferase-like enzyme
MAALKTRLFTPGPVEIPARILQALGQVPPHHRTEDFRKTLTGVLGELQWLHGTTGDVFLLAASGTGAMEAAVVNVMAPGQRALAVGGGKFGERWSAILGAYGVAHEKLELGWGESVDPAEVERRLKADASLAVVFATYSETSTGALHDIESLAKITRALGRRLVIDAVTGIGVHPLPQDAWGIDVVVCGSQKGMMIPPGLATVTLSSDATALIDGDRLPRFYWDLRKARKAAALGETAFTPPVSLVLALREALAMMKEEGLDALHLRHRRLAHAARAGAQACGWSLFPGSPSHAVTAITPPAGVEAPATVKRLRDVHGMVMAGGQDQLKGKIVRIGHMGSYDRADIMGAVAALGECTRAQGGSASGAVEAASAAWEAAG